MKTTFPSRCSTLLLSLAVSSGFAATVLAAPQAPVRAQEPLAGERAIEPFQRDLLSLAFRAASSVPVEPHRKTRSRLQESVVTTLLDLDQPSLAIEYAQHIGDWRRGSVYADFAFWCAQHGARERAQEYLSYADQLAMDVGNDPNPQSWRRDTIRLKIARAYQFLDEPAKAAEFARGTEATSGLAYDPVLASTAASLADKVEASALDADLERIDEVLIGEASGQAYNALVTCTRLYDRFFADADRRAAIEKRIRIGNSKLPPNLRLAAYIEVGDIAARKGDEAKPVALAAYRQARDFYEATEWTPEAAISFVPRLASLRHRVGESDGARDDLEQALVRYRDLRAGFRSTTRAEILRPFAEAFHTLGLDARSADIWALVIEEGVENPNSRPRSEDIVGTCLAMAKCRYEPTAELSARLREVVDGLGDPW
ncbi:MAG: hypothetical protein JNK78_11705 [Planctomycetes bacterium]|nr:hypothetical protein [Planctomycetota bacterium]